jgi:pilus assembly protein CpaB
MGVNVLLSNRATATPVQTEPVVTAAVAIPRGGTVTTDQVKLVNFPRGFSPPGAVAKVEEVVDRAVLTPLVAGEPVLGSKLAPKGAGRGLASLVPRGMRAFTIQTPNVASGVAGFILPGNRVDVLLTISDDDKNEYTGGGSTTTLLQNLEILAVDQTIDAPSSNKVDATQLRSVTLLVTPDQAAKLDLAQNKGILHLSLRNLGDDRPARTVPATMLGLRFLEEKPWDVRLKGVIEAVGKVLAERRKEAPAAKAPEPPRQVSFRTLRGLYEGRVNVDLPESAPAGR